MPIIISNSQSSSQRMKILTCHTTALFTRLTSSYAFARYKQPTNINLEEHARYLGKVQRAEQLLDEQLKTSQVPRRKRRVYDRPRIDRNISDYGAWRVHDNEEWIYKFRQHSMQVKLKLQIAPKWLVHAFGVGMLPKTHIRATHREFMFQDNRMNAYLLYEYRNTTAYKPNISGYDYQNQDHISPQKRKIRRVSPQQFWDSEQTYEFRVNTTEYAEHYKFEKWLQAQLQKRREMKSYDDFVQEKFGSFLTFNTPEQAIKFVSNQAIIYHISPKHFEAPTEKKEKAIQVPSPNRNLTWRKLGEEHRVASINTTGTTTTDKLEQNSGGIQ